MHNWYAASISVFFRSNIPNTKVIRANNRNNTRLFTSNCAEHFILSFRFMMSRSRNFIKELLFSLSRRITFDKYTQPVPRKINLPDQINELPRFRKYSERNLTEPWHWRKWCYPYDIIVFCFSFHGVRGKKGKTIMPEGQEKKRKTGGVSRCFHCNFRTWPQG